RGFLSRLTIRLQVFRTDGAIRNGGVLAAASCVSVVAGLLASKFWAVSVGPGGMGQASAFQALATLGTTIFGLGIGNAIVKHGAESAAAPGDPAFLPLVRASWSLWQRSILFGVLPTLLGLFIYRIHLGQTLTSTTEPVLLLWVLSAATATSLA